MIAVSVYDKMVMLTVVSALLAFIAVFFSTVAATTLVIIGIFGFTSSLILAILEEGND